MNCETVNELVTYTNDQKRKSSSDRCIASPTKEKVDNLGTDFSNKGNKNKHTISESFESSFQNEWSTEKCNQILKVITAFFSNVANRWEAKIRDGFVLETQMLLDYLYISYRNFKKHKEVFLATCIIMLVCGKLEVPTKDFSFGMSSMVVPNYENFNKIKKSSCYLKMKAGYVQISKKC